MSEPTHTGGCGCGAVRWQLSAPPTGAGYCHCTRCQRRTGTAAGCSATVDPSSFEVVEGAERVRAWKPPNGWEKHFCGDCGSALFSRDPGSGAMGVRMGSFDDDPGVRPTSRQFVASAAAWEPIPDDGLPRHPGRRPD